MLSPLPKPIEHAELEAELLGVKGFGPVDVGDRNDDQF
jgi:hypothetical protein